MEMMGIKKGNNEKRQVTLMCQKPGVKISGAFQRLVKLMNIKQVGRYDSLDNDTNAPRAFDERRSLSYKTVTSASHYP